MGRPHGLDGSFYVTRPSPELLVEGRRVLVGEGEAEIVRRAGTDARPIVRLSGVGDREAAEALRGSDLRVAAGDAPALGEDEWYAHELEGLEVWDGSTAVGVVRALRPLPSCDVLEVAREGGGEDLLVPLVRDAVRAVDVAGGRIDVDLRFLEGG